MKYPFIDEKQLKIIFTNMRVFRNMLNLNQEQFGKMAGMKQSEYSKLESGQKENWAKHWDDIANALGVNPFQLLIEEPQVSLKNKQLVINEMDKEEFEKNNMSFYLYHLLNAKQEREMREDKKEILKVTRKWKLAESKIIRLNKELVQREQTIKKLTANFDSEYTVRKNRVNSGGGG